jgi:hypothetical protein
VSGALELELSSHIFCPLQLHVAVTEESMRCHLDQASDKRGLIVLQAMSVSLHLLLSENLLIPHQPLTLAHTLMDDGFTATMSGKRHEDFSSTSTLYLMLR